LEVDSFGPRGYREVCTRLVDIESEPVFGGRPYDAFGAMAFLRSQRFVDPLRIGVMGWAYTGVLGTVVHAGAQQFFQQPPLTAIAFYPDCGFTASGEFVSPTLVLVGANDDWTPAAPCRRMARASENFAFPADLRVLEHAHHGFDDPELGAPREYPNLRNLYRNPALGAVQGYDAKAHQTALTAVKAFLEQTLLYRTVHGTLDTLPPAVNDAEWARGTWAIDPTQPGPDLPATGGSLFDALFATRRDGRVEHRLPTPFSALVAWLDARLPRDADGRSGLRRTLIPQGRSLQRDAAAPNHFESPRIVLAAVAEGGTDTPSGPLWTRDRLFIGYQARAQVLEVISYNPVAGRFEFQVVRNYGKDLEPTVYYARRGLCLSCHQSAAPIFPNAPWNETNTFGPVFQRLEGVKASFHGIPARPIRQDVNDIDRSTNRAVVLPILQEIWAHGCRNGDDAEGAANCRAGLFAAALEYRFSAASHYDDQSALYRHSVIPALKSAWRTRWPGGMLIPAANIPDRDPLAQIGPLPPRLDPLTPRRPDAVWRGPNAKAMRAIISALAAELPMAHIRRLSDALHDRALLNGHGVQRYQLGCDYTPLPRRGPVVQGKISCGGDSRTGIRVLGLLGVNQAGVPRVRLQELQLKRGAKLVDLEDDAGTIQDHGKGVELHFAPRHRRRGLVARDQDGTAVSELVIRLGSDPAASTDLRNRLRGPLRLGAEIDTLDDFAPMRGALAALLAADKLRPMPLFDGQSFDPRRMLAALSIELDITTEDGCCDQPVEFPPANLETPITGPSLQSHGGNLDPAADFRRFCAACHGEDTTFPPPFLRGDAVEVRRNLEHCAPRIAYRLQMWLLPGETRPKSGMPPRLSHGDSPSADGGVPGRDHLDRLRAKAAAFLDRNGGPALARVLAEDYDRLPPCLPSN
jgi:dienelactone hydrolase